MIGMNNEIFIESFLQSPQAMLIMKRQGEEVVALNREFASITGAKEGVGLHIPLSSLLTISGDPSSTNGMLAQRIRNGIMVGREGLIQQFSGLANGEDELLLQPRQITLQGEEYILISVSGVSGTKETEMRLKDALEEKEVLLREVHHRVKNNLQVISSLLHLQAQFVNDPKIFGYMTDSQNRVRALGYVYEHLYRAKDVGRIDFSEYTTRITQSLLREYSSFAKRVCVKYEVPAINLNPDTSIPLGLILNELVSNALRHAFPDEREGSIWIMLSANDDASYTLIIGDDGIGLPSGLDFDQTDSLGLLLVSSLVSQLDGTIALKRDQGTEFKISFQALQYKERR